MYFWCFFFLLLLLTLTLGSFPTLARLEAERSTEDVN